MTERCCGIDIIIEIENEFDFVLDCESAIDFEFEEIYVTGDWEYYEGEYRAIPKVIEQSFDTKQKVMKEDFIVEEIPYDETSNIYGTTVVIAS